MLLALALSAPSAPAQASSRSFTAADYWAFADRVMTALDERWRAEVGA